jgi:hypothetical protein
MKVDEFFDPFIAMFGGRHLNKLIIIHEPPTKNHWQEAVCDIL